MQRSRRAVLRRIGSEKGSNLVYNVSLVLVILLWAILFLLNLWISHGDVYQECRSRAWDEDRRRVVIQLADENLSRSNNSREGVSEMETVLSESNRNSVISIEEKSGDWKSQSDRFFSSVTLGLGEFRSKAFDSKSGDVMTGNPGSIVHRMEPGGADYNYASASRGAKVLAYNKEAKGASSVLCRDKDEYFRNPCSAAEKFVVVELSEETLVDTVEIANFEHYSSNPREIELLGSRVYPADSWVKLGSFTAANVKHAQRFVLPDPKWARYLKLNILSHYGSEFYCTLSLLEVYGVDAVEKMLEELVSVPAKLFSSDQKSSSTHKSSSSQKPEGEPCQNADGDDLQTGLAVETSVAKPVTTVAVSDPPVGEIRSLHVSRMPGDSVYKILMKKIKSLDINLSFLERYLEELNSRYGKAFKEIDKDLEEGNFLMDKILLEMRGLLESKETINKEVNNLVSWKSFASMQLEHLIRDNANLRMKMEEVWQNQVFLENKGSVVIFVACLIFGILAFLRLLVFLSIYSSWNFSANGFSFSWFFLLLNCSITIIILSL
nr:SUN domain-containing protein 4-like isoform X1 [Ipomoea batatas]